MEKRAFLAILLSIAVLIIYSTILTKSQPLQPLVDEGVTEIDPAQSVPISQPAVSRPSLPEEATVPEEIILAEPSEFHSFSTDKFELTFSNPGGNLDEIYLKDYDLTILGEQFLAVDEFNNLPFKLERQVDKAILVYQDSKVKIQKIFAFSPESYLIDWSLVVTNLSSQPKDYQLYINNSRLDLSKLATNSGFSRAKQFMEYVISLPDKVLRSNISRINQKTMVSVPTPLQWVGIRDRYFCTVLKPATPLQGYFSKPIAKDIVTTGVTDSVQILAGSAHSIQVHFYAGPQDINRLQGHGLGLENIVSFGFFSPISKMILKLLQLIYKVVPSWGFCIIVLSILITALLYPLTFKSLNSMREMQKLQPEIEQMRKAYKDQPQKMNQEIMKLYKEHKVNPFGGCLPLFLQFPIFISLYQALMRSIELKGSSFLWIKDLSQPDRLFVFEDKSFPVIGNEINILPLLMAAAMFVQQKLTSKSSPSASPEQQRMMMIIFPVMFGFIFYRFPSGLTLYWTCYTILSSATQWKLFHAKKG